MTSDFYITLPSNSSMEHFPENTQSCFRTKLSAPLVLVGNDWEVGLTEIFIPKTWYNVDGHNSAYSVTLDVEEWVPRRPSEYTIDVLLENNMNVLDFCDKVNDGISRHLKNNGVKFQPQKDKVTVELSPGCEVHILKEFSPKLLVMFHNPGQNLIVTDTKTLKYKPHTGSRTREKINIINHHIMSLQEFILPTNPIKPRGEYLRTGRTLSDVLNENIRLLDLEDKIKFSYSPEKREMYFDMSKGINIYFDKATAPTLMQKLGVKGERGHFSDKHTFQVDPKIEVKPGETMKVVIPVRIEDSKKVRKKIDFNLPPGLYKTSESLFSAFEHVSLSLLPNWKVLMRVLPNNELSLSKGLADMLGFKETDFIEGIHMSKYPLALDAGITEIYVYSDLVSSHHVGDTFAPLLRVVPARSESSDEIVKQYDRPLYFPLKNKFLETILIELRTGFGETITFTSGKTHVVLSFRRKKL